MKKIIKIIELLAKNFSPLRIFQVIETENLYLSGKCLEFGASENIKKNFSYFIKNNNNFDYSNLNVSTKKNFISIDLRKKFKIKSNKYNNILIYNVLEHIDDSTIAFKEIKRILAKNGKLIGSTPFLYQIHGAPKDFFRFTKDFFKQKLKKDGFKKIKIICLGCGPFVACFSLLYSYLRYIPILNHIILLICYLLDFVLQIFVKTKLKEIYPIGIFFTATK
jgi:SAM-dependent methyltransferase